MLSSSTSSSSQLIRPNPLFHAKQDLTDLIRQIFLFAPNPPEDLASLNSEASRAMNYSAHWRHLLERDFDISKEYCNILAQNTPNPMATLRAVYQRLTHLKTQHPAAVYQHYKNTIIDRSIPFVPLSAVGPSYPAVDVNDYLFYLCESLRLGNTGLVAHILLQVFPALSEKNKQDPSLTQYITDETVDIALKMAIKKAPEKWSKEEVTTVDNQELLQRLLPYIDDELTKKVATLILRDEKISSFDRVATNNLNQAVEKQQYHLAILFLQRGAVPNEQTLQKMICFSSLPFSYRYRDLLFQLLSLVPTYPQILNITWTTDVGTNNEFFKHLIFLLRTKADAPLIESIYNGAKRLPGSYNDEALSGIHRCLLEVASARGNLSVIEAQQKSEGPWIIKFVMAFAIFYGRLDVLQYCIKSKLMDKNTLLCSDEITAAIKVCPHKHIVKFFIEEYKLFQLDSHVAGYLVGLRQALKHMTFNPPAKCIANLKQSWLDCAALNGDVDIIEYLTFQTPKAQQLQATESALKCAVKEGHEVAVRYLVERSGIQPKKEHIEEAYRGSDIQKGCAELGVYLLSRCLDRLPPEFLSVHMAWCLISRMEKPNDAVNKVLDWLMSPAGRKYGFQIENFKSDHLHHAETRPLSPIMLAWLAAKLKMEFSDSYLNARAKSIFMEYGMAMQFRYRIEGSYEETWKQIYLDTFKFYCQKYHDGLSPAENASSSAVILRAVKKDDALEQKSQASSSVHSALSLDVDTTDSPPVEESYEVVSSAASLRR